MAGSYLHVVGDDGALLSNERVNGMLENGGDVFEAVEEMYGMIWFSRRHCRGSPQELQNRAGSQSHTKIQGELKCWN
jgi:hypothetical protein